MAYLQRPVDIRIPMTATSTSEKTSEEKRNRTEHDEIEADAP